MPDPYWEQVRKDAEEARRKQVESKVFMRGLNDLAGTPEQVKHRNRKGHNLYLCGECQHEQMEHWIVRTKAARPRCPSCGSLKYEPKSAEARKGIADLKDFRNGFDGPKGTGDGGFVVGQG